LADANRSLEWMYKSEEMMSKVHVYEDVMCVVATAIYGAGSAKRYILYIGQRAEHAVDRIMSLET
jgi:hypothetical protein